MTHSTLLIRSMAPDTASTKLEPPGLALRWSGRLPLAARILAINILPLALLAGSIFYIDGFRARLIEERRTQGENEARLVAQAIGSEDATALQLFVAKLGSGDRVRIRIIDASGAILADNWRGGRRSFTIPDPETERWQRQIAFRLDESIDWLVDAEVPPAFVSHEDRLPTAPEGASLSLAEDRTHMIEARAPVSNVPGLTVVTLRNARDIRRFVRAERTTLGYMIGLTILISVLLSLFLARTIVRPLKALAHAAMQVRFGFAREVNVPRLPARRDEIGMLARSVSDMSHELRERMDATEAFAADVAHELKNPLASLSSAIESLRRVKAPKLKAQLYDIVADDVRRLDRLVTDISDLSRIDAKMARTRFEVIDLGAMIEGLLEVRRARNRDGDIEVAFARPETGSTLVSADGDQLSRVFENLLDNAVSFSRAGGTVRISATRTQRAIVVMVDDDGPGIPESARESIFGRFHSDRSEAEFGKHSGLGLAIARTIVEAHDGAIVVSDKGPKQKGACFMITLPKLEP
jgi:two-component system, OmpR family, sensor histidine kinase ChvG